MDQSSLENIFFTDWLVLLKIAANSKIRLGLIIWKIKVLFLSALMSKEKKKGKKLKRKIYSKQTKKKKMNILLKFRK